MDVYIFRYKAQERPQKVNDNLGERTFQKAVAHVRSLRLKNKGRNFKKAITTVLTAPKRREGTR